MSDALRLGRAHLLGGLVGARQQATGVVLTMSLDGYIAGPNDSNELPLGEGGEALFEWFFTGDTPSRHDAQFKLSKASAEVFDAGIDSCGAVVTGRRTYDIAGAWGGDGPVPGLPLLVLTHRVPAEVPETSVPYTFVTDGIESAIKQAKVAAGDKTSHRGSRQGLGLARASVMVWTAGWSWPGVWPR